MYGACEFADLKMRTKGIKTKLLTHIKRILKLPMSTNYKKLMLTLGLPDFKCVTRIRLVEVLKKYYKQFGILPNFYKDQLNKIFDKENVKIEDTVEKTLETVNMGKLRESMFRRNLKKTAEGLGIKIGVNYMQRNRTLYGQHNKKDHLTD
jgi:hypothetical protein